MEPVPGFEANFCPHTVYNQAIFPSRRGTTAGTRILVSLRVYHECIKSERIRTVFDDEAAF